MLKSGNADPKQCIENLISIIRGEIPFDRVRGIDARIIDSPEEDARIDLTEDIRWNVETYEPRVNADYVGISVDDSINGGFDVDINISEIETDEED